MLVHAHATAPIKLGARTGLVVLLGIIEVMTRLKASVNKSVDSESCFQTTPNLKAPIFFLIGAVLWCILLGLRRDLPT